MSQSKTKTFYTTEALPLWRKLKGPVESFVVLDEKEIIAQAVETGCIEVGAFRDCAVFSDTRESLEQKHLRYEAKRAQDVLDILEQSQIEEGHEPTLEDKFAALFAQQTIGRAVLVEAARKYGNEQADGTVTPRHELLYTTVLTTSQGELFPQPDQKIAAYAMTKVLQKIQEIDPSQAVALTEEYPFLKEENAISAEIKLSFEKEREWHDTLHQKYDSVFAGVREEMSEEALSNATLAAATTLFMKQAGFPMETEATEGWTVIERDDVAGFRVEPGLRQVICGRRKAEITQSNFEKLMVHEIGVHATRAENGYRLGYEAVQTGLPGYQEGEEGLGLLMENLWTGDELDKVGRDHFRYLAVCYADGQLDGEKHNEQDTLRFISRLIAAQKPDGLSDDIALSTARKTGVDHVKRAFRGMPEGVIMYSNLAYLAGKLEIVGLINTSNMSAVQLLAYVQRGKFSPFDEMNVSLMQEAGEPTDGWL